MEHDCAVVFYDISLLVFLIFFLTEFSNYHKVLTIIHTILT